MRVATQLGGVAVACVMLAFACSASDNDTSHARAASKGASSQEVGGGGGSRGVARTPIAGGGAVAESEAGAAGAAGACAGDYYCPLVGYGSSATISFDLPISVAGAADAVFTACRDSECHTAKGSATVAPNPEWGWVSEVGGRGIYLTFDDTDSAPFGVLQWNFQLDFTTIPNDHYSLTVQPVGASAPIALFDTEVNYAIVEDDPTLVSDGFCYHCSEVSIAKLDLRTTQ
jgi:hypothetical protein